MTCRAHKPLRTTCGSSQPIASSAGFIRKRSLISIRTGGRRTADNDITAYVPVRTVTLSSDTDHAMHRTSQSLALESYPPDGQTQRLASRRCDAIPRNRRASPAFHSRPDVGRGLPLIATGIELRSGWRARRFRGILGPCRRFIVDWTSRKDLPLIATGLEPRSGYVQYDSAESSCQPGVS